MKKIKTVMLEFLMTLTEDYVICSDNMIIRELLQLQFEILVFRWKKKIVILPKLLDIFKKMEELYQDDLGQRTFNMCLMCWWTGIDINTQADEGTSDDGILPCQKCRFKFVLFVLFFSVIFAYFCIE
jgi:hypothetical protein